MKSAIEKKLKVLGFELPNPVTPLANYIPYVLVDNIIFISGQLSIRNGELEYLGKVGHSITVEECQIAVQICTLNIISQLKKALNGDLNQIKRCVRLAGFINSTSDFTEHSRIMDTCSDLIIQLWGEEGYHARTVIGVSSLPFGASVEIEAVFERRIY